MAADQRHTGRYSRYSKKNDGPEPITSILGSSFSSLGLASKIREHNIKKAWAECVGSGIARRSAPARLIGTVLHCSVATSAWMTELTYQKGALISKINSKVGPAAVTDIIFRIGPVAPYGTQRPAQTKAPMRDLTPEEMRFIETTTSKIKDEKLKEAIKRAIARSKA